MNKRFLVFIMIITVSSLFPCSVELSYHLAFDDSSPEFSNAVYEMVNSFKRLLVEDNKDNRNTARKFLDEFCKNHPTPPPFYHDKDKYKIEISRITDHLKALLNSSDSELMHENIRLVDAGFVEIYEDRGKKDPRFISGKLEKIKKEISEKKIPLIVALKNELELMVKKASPSTEEEKIEVKKYLQIIQLLDEMRNNISQFLHLHSQIILLENQILDLKWFSQKRVE